MFQSLSEPQRSLVRGFLRSAGEVYFHGFDQNELPVISFQDAYGNHDAFAILRSPKNRPGTVSTVHGLEVGIVELTTEPAYPTRWFTDEELAGVHPDDHELLTTLARPQPERTSEEGG